MALRGGPHNQRFDDREPRLNEYFIERDGISREVIQADICRYLGNDALVRPGVHQNRQGYFIRAYRNLTSEMIADLKNDSSRWEAESLRREQQGFSRAPYDSNAFHESRTQLGQSHGNYQVAGNYNDPYPSAVPNPYAGAPAAPYGGTSYTTTTAQSYVPAPAAYNPIPNPYVQVPAGTTTASEAPGAYTYAPGTGYPYNEGRQAPRYTGPGYEAEPEYSTTASGVPYSSATAAVTHTTTAAGPRVPAMEPGYPEPGYDPRNPGRQPQRERDRDHRRR